MAVSRRSFLHWGGFLAMGTTVAAFGQKGIQRDHTGEPKPVNNVHLVPPLGHHTSLRKMSKDSFAPYVGTGFKLTDGSSQPVWIRLISAEQFPAAGTHQHEINAASALKTLFSWHGFSVFATMVAGQFAYFIVGSFGLTIAGLLFCSRQILSARNDAGHAAHEENVRSACVLIGLAPISIIALGAIAFFHWDRFEGGFWIYGRYLDGAILPVLAIGLAAFRPDIRCDGCGSWFETFSRS